MTNRIAVVLGATGLIGNELVQQLAENKSYSEIRIIGRRNSTIESEKIRFHAIEMDHILQHASLFDADDVFCCLGTTMKTAGSREAFRKVDYDMIVDAAKASENLAKHFIIISSLGASTESKNFYLKTKGEAEKAVLAMNIKSIHILRPSILFGNRKESRGGEKIGIALMKFVSPLMLGSLKKYKGNEAKNVASAMIHYALSNENGKFIHESREIEMQGRIKHSVVTL